jgi:ATP-dependent 26S proteasome regulatory subunit
MIILNGIPGSGKTSLVKSLISECMGKFVYIPVEMVEKMMSPNVWGTFQEYKDENHPYVLILEDADAYLSIRNKENASKISHLLNIGDGIVGASLDIRIIATTNATTDDIDPAFLRPGRLNSLVEINSLNKEDCINFLKVKGKEHMMDQISDKEEYTLAELYAIVNYDANEG